MNTIHFLNFAQDGIWSLIHFLLPESKVASVFLLYCTCNPFFIIIIITK